MRIILVFLSSILIVALQITIMAHLAILAVAPNLILASVLAWATWQQKNKNDWLVLIPIFIFDLIAGQPFGLTSLSLCLVFFSIEEFGAVFFKQNDLPAVLFFIFFGVLFFEFCQILLSHLFAIWHLMEPIKLDVFYFYAILPISFLYNGVLGLLLFAALKKSKILNNNGSFTKF